MFRTLIIEHGAFFRQLLKESLLSQFPLMEVLEAENGDQALKIVKIAPPDLIFTDIRLPEENGLELTRKIRGQHPDITIIILTSYDLPEYREAAIQYHANHFFSKDSTTNEDILALVKTVVIERNIVLNSQDPQEL